VPRSAAAGGVASYDDDVTVTGSGSYTTAGADVSVLRAEQSTITCKVVSTDAGDSDVVSFHFIGRGEDQAWPTIASWIVNVPTAGDATAIKETVVNVSPYVRIKLLKITNGNSNDVTANSSVGYTY